MSSVALHCLKLSFKVMHFMSFTVYYILYNYRITYAWLYNTWYTSVSVHSHATTAWKEGLKPQSTYICRVQSSVWRLPKYWPPTPFPSSECVLPTHQRQGGIHYTLAGRWGVNILEDAGHWIGLLQFNPSTPQTYVVMCAFGFIYILLKVVYVSLWIVTSRPLWSFFRQSYFAKDD